MIQEDRRIEEYIQPKLDSWEYLDLQNHILVHQRNEIVELTNVNYNQSTNLLTGRVNRAIDIPMLYYNKAVSKNSKIGKRKVGDKISITKQVHLFIDELVMNDDGTCNVNLNDIYKVDISKQATAINALVSIPIVAGAGAVGVTAIIIACGCPHVYINDGEELKWEQTLFTGAKAPQLARSDLKAINDYFPTQESLTLTLKNDEEEQQFIDKLSLKVVDHPADVNLAIENNSNLYAYHKATSPIAVTDQDGNNQSQATANKDGVSYDFKPEKLTDLSTLNVTFKPESVGDSRLILHVKNTKWSGYLYNEFNKLFGSEHAKWVEKNKDKSKEEREAWMRQEGIKLLVEVKRNNIWEPLSEINLVGDVAYESLAVPIDVESLENLEIRLRSGFHFWEVDYLGLAHETENIDVKIHDLTPTIATNAQGESQLDKLRGTDEKYLISTPDNPSTVVTFDNLPIPNLGKRSLFLEANGYYLIQKQYTGKPKYKRLSKFKKPGELSRFSKEKYTELQKQISFQ